MAHDSGRFRSLERRRLFRDCLAVYHRFATGVIVFTSSNRTVLECVFDCFERLRSHGIQIECL